MTDNEIKKALNEWGKEINDDYKRLKLLDAPMDYFEESHIDKFLVLSNALDLINRQQAEIVDERAKGNICAEVIARQDKEIAKYKAEIKNYSRNNRSLTESVTEMQKALKKRSAEIERLTLEYAGFEAGVKQFAKDGKMVRVKAVKEFAESVKLEFYKEFDEIIPSIMADKIDNLLKEMVGDVE